MRWLVCIALIIVPLYLRTLLGARTHLLRGEVYEVQGNYYRASEEYRKAVSWSSPFNAYASKSLQKFETLALEKLEGHIYQREALRSLRAGLLSSRSFLRPEQEKKSESLVRVEERLAEYQAPERADGYVEVVGKPKIIFGWQILGQIFFFGWIGSALYVIFRGFNKDGEIIRTGIVRGVTSTALTFVGWLFCLSMA